MNEDDTFFTSDILIYNILESCSDKYVNKCNLKFIDKSVPAMEDDTIYVASVDWELMEEMFDSANHKALVNIYVKTKDTDYVKASRFLKTVIKHIKHILRNNDECKRRHITFRNITFEYASKYTLKGVHLLIQMLEHESYELDDEYDCIKINDETGIDIE